MQRTTLLTLVLASAMQFAACAHNLEEEYRFSAILDDGYKLHWSFNLEQQTIAFAVNVSTTGWVGFGLSPNGQMPQSDVVIGWVDNDGTTTFHDRFAIDRFLPPVDESQDWFLVSGEEENGYTILEFTRNLTTCDDRDLNIKADTARIIWAYHSMDPSDLQSLSNLRHEQMGSISLNLLGGSTEERTEPNSDFFILRNENYTIPEKDTTYWCSVHNLPENVRQQEKYIYRIGPALSESSKQYVHHVVVYLCSNLDLTHVGQGIECSDVSERHPIALCRTEILITAWAVGGEDFVFPRDVAFPIGGEGNPNIIVLEMHYDNPNGDSEYDLTDSTVDHYTRAWLDTGWHCCKPLSTTSTMNRILRLQFSGVMDSSGLKFTFTSDPQRHRAAILTTGYSSTNFLVIPPGRESHTINSVCSSECTQKYFPPEGITVFGNMLHTHLTGHGLVVRHFRQNEQCGVLEELKPIDENRRYDFNYQQVTLLPRKVQILPGDSLQVQCFYRTMGINNVTLGGESTRQEMCVAFLMYYPALDVGFCSSQATGSAFSQFAQQYIDQSQQQNFFNSLANLDTSTSQVILDQVDWTNDASAMIEKVTGSSATSICIDSKNIFNSLFSESRIPSSECPYEAPDECTGTQPLSCCERVGSGAIPQSGSHQLLYSLLCTITMVAVLIQLV